MSTTKSLQDLGYSTHWTLSAPAGRQWHRTDGWTQEMLPEGWRPLLLDEPCQKGDMVYVGGSWSDGIDTGFRMRSQHLHTITKRPLPSEPVAVEGNSSHGEFVMACALNDKDREIEALTFERDQLRKELEDIKQRLTEKTSLLAFAGVREIGYKRTIETLTTENAALKKCLDKIKQSIKEQS